MVSRRHITSMKKKEKRKQHKQKGEEIFPMSVKQSRKSVVPRPRNLGSGSVWAPAHHGLGVACPLAHRVKMRCLGGKSQRCCRAWSPSTCPLLWFWLTVGSWSRSREG